MLSEENEQQGQSFLSLGDIETQALSICILKNNISLQFPATILLWFTVKIDLFLHKVDSSKTSLGWK